MREFSEQDVRSIVSLMQSAISPPSSYIWHVEIKTNYYHFSYSALSEEEAEDRAAEQSRRFPHASITIRPPGAPGVMWKPNGEWKHA